MSYGCPKCRGRTLSVLSGFEAEATPPTQAAVVGAAAGPGAEGEADMGLMWAGAPMTCDGCGGMWLPGSHLYLLEEVESDDRHIAQPGNGIDHGSDSRAGLCPMGHGFLTRARLEPDASFYLERCAHCGGFWFDAGEPERLASAGLVERLEILWDPGWQKRQREARSRERYTAYVRRELGEALFDRLEAVGLELAGHPKRSLALAWLQETVASRDEGPVDEQA